MTYVFKNIKNHATMNSATNYQVIVILFNTVLAKLNQTFDRKGGREFLNGIKITMGEGCNYYL